jgi:hypothetical protein
MRKAHLSLPGSLTSCLFPCCERHGKTTSWAFTADAQTRAWRSNIASVLQACTRHKKAQTATLRNSCISIEPRRTSELSHAGRDRKHDTGVFCCHRQLDDDKCTKAMARGHFLGAAPVHCVGPASHHQFEQVALVWQPQFDDYSPCHSTPLKLLILPVPGTSKHPGAQDPV